MEYSGSSVLPPSRAAKNPFPEEMHFSNLRPSHSFLWSQPTVWPSWKERERVRAHSLRCRCQTRKPNEKWLQSTESQSAPQPVPAPQSVHTEAQTSIQNEGPTSSILKQFLKSYSTGSHSWHTVISLSPLCISHVRQVLSALQFPPNILPKVTWAARTSSKLFSYLSDLVSS